MFETFEKIRVKNLCEDDQQWFFTVVTEDVLLGETSQQDYCTNRDGFGYSKSSARKKILREFS